MRERLSLSACSPQSIGGNIINASPISDLNPVFMASGAKLTLVSRGEQLRQRSVKNDLGEERFTTQIICFWRNKAPYPVVPNALRFAFIQVAGG